MELYRHEKHADSGKNRKVLSGAVAFITLMGIVSLFSDMTHEGARSILGEYLNLTGASAATIGFVSGIGELCGYSLRLLSGYVADKTKKYWMLIIAGYTMQVLAIPLLAFVPENGWLVACGLVIMERVGKAIKKPAKNTLVSFAASEVGTGKGFAYQEFLDQLGAFLGPVILFVISFVKGTGDLFSTYRLCFLVLGIPALITIMLVMVSRIKYLNPEMFEKETDENAEFKIEKSFVIYMIAIYFHNYRNCSLGALYDFNPVCLAAVSVVTQLCAICFYILCIKVRKNK